MHRRDSQPQSRKIKDFSYRPDHPIGKGYSSVVYRGTNDLTNEPVAIKAIDMKGVRDAASRQMLDCQIQALTTLKHHNVLTCYTVVKETSHCYIITELCDEGDISALLKKKKRLNQKETLKLTKDIVSGFIQIAEKGFLHRDLKLANIFLSKGKAIIADFGFAKKHRGIFEKQKYNVGSPLYMSPQALKKNIYTIKNDIWSIGIMVYQLLHGQTPWQCRTEKQLMEKMVRYPVKFRQSLNLSPSIKQFIKKCLQVNQDTRMSLEDLKDWNANNSHEILAEGTMVWEPRLKKPTSQQETHVLGDVSNRMSTRSQSKFHSKSIREPSIKTNLSNANNIGISAQNNKNNSVLSKKTIQKNNNTLIQEINSFRLLYKIYQKMKKILIEQGQLIKVIGNEILKRVNQLMDIMIPPKQNRGSNQAKNLGLVQTDLYLNDQINSSVKKYKTVVKQYYKKYNKEITTSAIGRQVSSKSLMKEILDRNLLQVNKSNQMMTLVYWMLEWIQMKNTVTKEYLEGVIEPKESFMNATYLQDRVRLL